MAAGLSDCGACTSNCPCPRADSRVGCARKFFAELNNNKAGEERVAYDVVTDYSELRSLVGAKGS